MGRDKYGKSGGIFPMIVAALLTLIAKKKEVLNLPNVSTTAIFLNQSEVSSNSSTEVSANPYTNVAVLHRNIPENTFGKAMMEGLDWKIFESSLVANDAKALNDFAHVVFYQTALFSTMEPKTPINVTCQAPSLLTPQPPDGNSFCSPLTSNVFNGSI